jgi:hypothetical protein
MPFIPVLNVAQVGLVGEIDGQETVNDLYFVSTAPPITALSLAALAASLDTWYSGEIAPQLNENWAYSHTRARDLTTQFSFIATNADNAGTIGGVTGECTPNNVAANVTFGTTLAGRNNHGSNRVPALSNSMVDINRLDVTWLQNIVIAYSLLVAPSTALPGGWTWVVVSRYSGSSIIDGKVVPTPRVAGIYHEIFDVYFTDQFVDSQKTRLPKHGR